MMSASLAEQFAGLFHELTSRQPFSDVVDVDLTGAGAWGRAERLLICQCDCDDLSLLSYFRRWWLVYSEGLHADVEWPLNQRIVEKDGWEAEFPFLKFATDGLRVRFELKFGERWLVCKEGPLMGDGRFAVEDLIELCRYD